MFGVTQEIQLECENFITSTRTVENCLNIWRFGRKKKSQHLSDISFILSNFTELACTSEFLNLTSEEVRKAVYH